MGPTSILLTFFPNFRRDSLRYDSVLDSRGGVELQAHDGRIPYPAEPVLDHA